MKSIFQIALLTLSVIAVTVVSGMYVIDAAPTKHFKDWCYDTLGTTVCSFESKQDCNASREIAEAVDPNVSKCYHVVGKV